MPHHHASRQFQGVVCSMSLASKKIVPHFPRSCAFDPGELLAVKEVAIHEDPSKTQESVDQLEQEVRF